MIFDRLVAVVSNLGIVAGRKAACPPAWLPDGCGNVASGWVRHARGVQKDSQSGCRNGNESTVMGSRGKSKAIPGIIGTEEFHFTECQVVAASSVLRR